MRRIRRSRPADGEQLVAIWRSAVNATPDFVDPVDREAIDKDVQVFLPQSEVWLAVDEQDVGIGFMGLADGEVESLFIAAPHRGKGLGRQFIEFARSAHASLTVAVNEQNDQAVGFYRHLGFVVIGRSPTDAFGRPYPLLHLHLTG